MSTDSVVVLTVDQLPTLIDSMIARRAEVDQRMRENMEMQLQQRHPPAASCISIPSQPPPSPQPGPSTTTEMQPARHSGTLIDDVNGEFSGDHDSEEDDMNKVNKIYIQ